MISDVLFEAINAIDEYLKGSMYSEPDLRNRILRVRNEMDNLYRELDTCPSELRPYGENSRERDAKTPKTDETKSVTADIREYLTEYGAAWIDYDVGGRTVPIPVKTETVLAYKRTSMVIGPRPPVLLFISRIVQMHAMPVRSERTNGSDPLETG